MADKRFNASVNCRHRALLTQVMSGAPVGGGTVVITPEQDAALRDLAGALNYWATQPGGCDTEVDVKPEIPFGDYARKTWEASTDVIVAFPFVMPAKGTLHIMVSEFKGQNWLRTMVISPIAGDLTAPVRSDGMTPDIYLTPGQEYPAGTLLYANNVLTQDPTVPNSSGTGISIVWPAP